VNAGKVEALLKRQGGTLAGAVRVTAG
jgi:hypothetical protein